VGNLAWSTGSEELQAVLSKFGAVVDCDTGDVRNGRTRGWAIVTCGSAADAEAIMQSCNDMDVDGRRLNVRVDDKPSGGKGGGRGGGGKGSGGGKGGGRGRGDPALEGRPENPSGTQVVVRNLPWSVTSEMLKETFEQIGPVAAAEVVCHADSGRSKGWGTVKFENSAFADDAIQRFGGVELAGRPMTVMMDRYS